MRWQTTREVPKLLNKPLHSWGRESDASGGNGASKPPTWQKEVSQEGLAVKPQAYVLYKEVNRPRSCGGEHSRMYVGAPTVALEGGGYSNPKNISKNASSHSNAHSQQKPAANKLGLLFSARDNSHSGHNDKAAGKHSCSATKPIAYWTSKPTARHLADLCWPMLSL